MRRTAWAVILLLAGAASAWGQGVCYHETYVGVSGRPVANPTLRVCTEPASSDGSGNCIPTAHIFYDAALSNPLSNPMSGDSQGVVRFCALQGSYHLQYNDAFGNQRDFSTVPIGAALPAGVSGNGNSGLTITGAPSSSTDADTVGARNTALAGGTAVDSTARSAASSAQSTANSAQSTANSALPANGVTTSAGGNLSATTLAVGAAIPGGAPANSVAIAGTYYSGGVPITGGGKPLPYKDVLADCGLQGAGASCVPGSSANCHDDSAALATCTAANPYTEFVFRKTATTVAHCDYYFASMIHPIGNSIWYRGTSTELFGVGDIFCFPSGVTGIGAHNAETINVRVRDLVLWGGDQWQPPINTYRGAAIYWPHNWNAATPQWSALEGSHVTGNGTVGLNDAISGGTLSGQGYGGTFFVKVTSGTPDTFQWAYYPQRSAPYNAAKAGDPVLTYSAPVAIVANADNTLQYGVTIKWAASTGHTTGDYWTINAGAVYGDNTCPKCNVTQAVGTSDGINMEAPGFDIDNVVIRGFARHGFYCNSYSDVHAGGGNCDEGRISHVYALYNRGSGFHFQGGDSNGNTSWGLNGSINQGWGINDASFLGNTHISPFSQTNGFGEYNSPTYNGVNRFIGNYSEGDQPPARASSRTKLEPMVEPAVYGGAVMTTGGGGQDTTTGYGAGVHQTSPIQASASPSGSFGDVGNVIAGLAVSASGDTNTALQLIDNSAARTYPYITELRKTWPYNAAGTAPCTGTYGNSGWWGFRTGGIADTAGCYNYPFLFADADTPEAGWTGSIGAASYGGSSGLNDATRGGTLQPGVGGTYTVNICATGTPDSYQYKNVVAGPYSYTACTPMAAGGSANALDHGVTITWAASTGHTLNDTWTIAITEVQGNQPPAWMPNGFYLGTTPVHGRRPKLSVAVSTPTTGAYGDRFVNGSPTANGVSEWICTNVSGCTVNADWTPVTIIGGANSTITSMTAVESVAKGSSPTTGVTPTGDSNDTSLATTAWVRGLGVGASYPAQVYALNTGATHATTGPITMIASTPAGAQYEFHFSFSPVDLGTGCTGGGSLYIALLYTDGPSGWYDGGNSLPFLWTGSNTTQTSLTLPYTGSFAGTSIVHGYPRTISPQTGSAVQWKAVYTAGSGCSVGQNYSASVALVRLQ